MVTRRHIAVIGAGLAGAACARVFARAGFQVTVMDEAGESAQGASGNPIGIFHPLISKDHNLASQWSEAGIVTTMRWCEELLPIAHAHGVHPIVGNCGVAQMNEQASDLIHWAPQCGWIRPRRFVVACLEDARRHGAQIRFNTEVIGISDDAGLTFRTGEEQQFDAVVVCAAQQAADLLSHHTLGLNAIRGTITSYRIDQGVSLPCVICADGYATPVIDGEMVVGASYERLPDGQPDPIGNLDRLRVVSAALAAHCETAPSTERTSVRSATIDRMPLAGALRDLRRPLTPSMSQLHQLPRNPRLWVLGGLGSRGLTSAPLGAELMLAQMLGLALPVHTRLARAVDPLRFVLRRHQRREQA